jgi:hypothetical protein
VQPKAIAFPTDAKLMHRARERLVRLARKTGVELRQSYERVGKHALIAHQRYAHAKQFKRANRALKTIRTYLGRITREIVRKIKGDPELESVFAHPLMLGRRVREQRQHQRGQKVYSLHATEAECIGKGKAHRPYEFGVKVSLATTLNRSKGGQFIAHAKAPPGNPYDGHTLATVIPEIETQIGANLARIVADRGYRGHNAPPDHSSRSVSQVRDAASPRPSNASCAAVPPSNRSLATRKRSTAWAETTSPEPTATPPTPSSPPPATTSAACSNGSPPFGVSSSWRSWPPPSTLPSPCKTVFDVQRAASLRQTARSSRSTPQCLFWGRPIGNEYLIVDGKPIAREES